MTVTGPTNTNWFTVVTASRQSFVFGQKATAPVLPLAPLRGQCDGRCQESRHYDVRQLWLLGIIPALRKGCKLTDAELNDLVDELGLCLTVLHL